MQDLAYPDGVEEICALLGYVDAPGFVRPHADGRYVEEGHVVREAFNTVGVSGIYRVADGHGRSGRQPVVYVAAARDDRDLLLLRRRVWTQGVAPFLVVAMPDRTVFCSGFEPPSSKAVSSPRGAPLPAAFAGLSATEISSSLTWLDYEVNLKSSVDTMLVAAIDGLNAYARQKHPSLRQERGLLNALIGKFLYLYVLVDRGIVSEDWLRRAKGQTAAGRAFAAAVCSPSGGAVSAGVEWGTQDAFVSLDAIDHAINGSVFAIDEARRCAIPDEVCRLVHDAVRCGTTFVKDGQQLGFLDVSYGVIRTETISAIYERFVTLEGPSDKADDGVFYTPPFLVDHVLDRVEEVSPFTRGSRIIDPTAGSGIFLVAAYRRIMEASTPPGGWAPEHVGVARDTLLSCIFGIEKDLQAAAVCRFSLYLTLLDYVGNASISVLEQASGEGKFLPGLRDNVRTSDAFERPFGTVDFTHVVGNPPWPAEAGQKDRTNARPDRKVRTRALVDFLSTLNKKKEPIGFGRLSDAFVWLAVKTLAAKGGVVGLVLPTRSLVGRNAERFSHALAAATTLASVGNLSHLRRKLFAGAEAPACVVVFRNTPDLPVDPVAVYRPLLSSLPMGSSRSIWALLVSQTDMQFFEAADFRSGSNGWFEQIMLRSLDRRTRVALSTWTRVRSRSFGDFVRRSDLVVARGASPSDGGVARSAQIEPIDWAALSDVRPPYRPQFAGNAIIVPRSMADAKVLDGPHAFSSTFNAILPKAQVAAFEVGMPRQRDLPLMDQAAASGLVAFLDSGVLRYFASLFGATFLMDGARFERQDLLSVPIPFEDMSDPALAALSRSSDVDRDVLDAMKAGDEFRQSFEEFKAFRARFSNARLPSESFRVPDARDVELYCDRFRAEISSAPTTAGYRLEGTRPPSSVPSFLLLRSGRESVPYENPSVDVGRFLATTIVSLSNDAGTVLVTKAPAKHAWTTEQAVSDARAVAREIELYARTAVPT